MAASDLQTSSGRRLRKVRRDKELTATYVAAQAGVSRNYLHRVEGGMHEPSDDVRIRLAEVLGVQVGDIWSYPDTAGVA